MSEGSPSGIPYIGSRISLISVSGIRYEGMLYSIDPKQSTVSLQSGEESLPSAPLKLGVHPAYTPPASPSLPLFQCARLGQKEDE